MKRIVQITFKNILAAIFFFSGVMKIYNPMAFQDELLMYGFFSSHASAFWALWIPAWECVLGLGLLQRRFCILSMILSVVTLFAFLVVLVSAWHFGAPPSCGCLGPIQHSVPMAVTIDVVLLAMMGWLLADRKRLQRGER